MLPMCSNSTLDFSYIAQFTQCFTSLTKLHACKSKAHEFTNSNAWYKTDTQIFV